MMYQGIQYLALYGEWNGREWEIHWVEGDETIKIIPVSRLLDIIKKGGMYLRKGDKAMIVFGCMRYALDANTRRVLDRARRRQPALVA